MIKVLNITFALLFMTAMFKGCQEPLGQAEETGDAPGSVSQQAQDIEVISVKQAYALYSQHAEKVLFIDVRTQAEFASGHIKGAVHIPAREIAQRLDEIPADRYAVVYCDGEGCSRSDYAAKVLADHGYSPVYDIGGGGIVEWMYHGYPHKQED